MTLAAFAARAAQRDALVEQNVVTDFGRLANDDAEAVVDKEALADLGAGVNFNARQQPSKVGHETSHDVQTLLVQTVRQTMEENSVQTGVTEQDFQAALGGRIFPLDGLNVLT
jgi:hypothetical protein